MDYRRKQCLLTIPISEFIFILLDHWHDILIGSLLGLLMSFFAYRQYYPSLAAPFSHKPYSPRIPHDDPVLPSHTTGAGSSRIPEARPNTSIPSNRDYRDSMDESFELTTAAGTVPNNERHDMKAVWSDNTPVARREA